MTSIVAIVRCDSYEEGCVDTAVRRAVELLGGMGRFVRSGERIVLKPNVLYGTPPERCVTTHPAVFTAVAQIALELGARVTYGDSSAVAAFGYSMRRAGLMAAAQSLGIEQEDFENAIAVAHPRALIAHHLVLSRPAVEADGLISLPKLKTHGLTRITGAVKNQYGCVPGMVKGRYHAQYPDPYDFCKLLVDINTRLPVRLCVMDAVIAMEGNGPGGGEPRKIGAILASADPVALDMVACRLINMPTECVPTISLGEKAGLGVGNWEQITCVGDFVDEFIVSDFDAVRLPPVPLGRGRIRRLLRELIAPRPVVRRHLCVRCGRCVEICPVDPKAVNWGQAGTQAPPRHEYTRCIRCFCCQEVCPVKAMVVRTPVLGRLLPPLAFLSLLASRLSSMRALKTRR